MSQDKTTLFDVKEIDTEMTRQVLKEVYEALEERGYNPTNQLVGYLISGDPGYISSYKDARKKMVSMDRASIIAILLKGFLK